MADGKQRDSRSSRFIPRRSRKTDTSDRTQQDPVVIQQKPEPAVIEAIQAMPDTPSAPAQDKPAAATELKFFKQEFIDKLAKHPPDLLFYYDNAKKALQAMRSSNLPGDDERAATLTERLAELRRIVKGLGYPG